MTTEPTLLKDIQPRDAAYWAQQATIFEVAKAPTGALNLNVNGHRALSPLQGFGQMWQKTFRVRLTGSSIEPAEVIKTWKDHFPEFWPKWDRFYRPLRGIAPGEVAVINMLLPGDMPYGLPLSTGILVLYADEESFTFMCPEGHMFAGWITFSAFEEEGCTVAQIQVLIRANDPVYEVGFRLGASRSESKFWQMTLASLAAHFGVTEPVETQTICVDPRVQWSQFRNIWYNAAIRTTLFMMTYPARWLARQIRR